MYQKEQCGTDTRKHKTVIYIYKNNFAVLKKNFKLKKIKLIC